MKRQRPNSVKSVFDQELPHTNYPKLTIYIIDSEAITIAHSSFAQVINYTKNWSRLNLGVTVAYNTDLDKAISVIEAVAKELSRDVKWQQRILEQPKVLGVDDFGDNSITIRLLIKTKPRKQWEIGREYRRRLNFISTQVP